jgi:hypothetical protein
MAALSPLQKSGLTSQTKLRSTGNIGAVTEAERTEGPGVRSAGIKIFLF